MNTPLWLYNLAFWSAQITLLALAAGLLLRIFQIRQPRVLLAYWRALLAVSLLLPFIQRWHRLQGLAATTSAPEIAGGRFVLPSTPVVTHWNFPSLQIIAQILGLVIIAGIASRFAILALGLLKLRQFRRTSSSISSLAESAAALEEMRTFMNVRAEFRLSAAVDSPVTFGFVQPLILLPERFQSMDAGFQAAIACHELQHARRHDWAHHLAEELIRAALWFHPAVAWLIGRIRLAREQVVDREVVRLTKSPIVYVQALLEFTNGRTVAIPASPFLAERHLAERVAFMLKEVRMSRARLISSLTVIACCLALAAMLAVWTFPLKAASRSQNPVRTAIARGPSGSAPAAASKAVVDANSIWMDKVKKGTLPLKVHGAGTLVRGADSAILLARVQVPESLARDVQPNQYAEVQTQKEIVKGHVSTISSEVSSGMRSVDIALDSFPPQTAAAGVQADGAIEVGKLENVLYVGRPAQNTESSVFKVINNGREAVRVKVKFGRGSANTVEVLDGLNVEDTIILSDMSNYASVDRIQIK